MLCYCTSRHAAVAVQPPGRSLPLGGNIYLPPSPAILPSINKCHANLVSWKLLWLVHNRGSHAEFATMGETEKDTAAECGTLQDCLGAFFSLSLLCTEGQEAHGLLGTTSSSEPQPFSAAALLIPHVQGPLRCCSPCRGSFATQAWFPPERTRACDPLILAQFLCEPEKC